MIKPDKLPEWVEDEVLAICRGYDMRASYLMRRNGAGDRAYAIYAKYNSAIDRSIERTCDGANEAAAMRLALTEGMTWERITACACGRRRFYELRRLAIWRIATELQLLN